MALKPRWLKSVQRGIEDQMWHQGPWSVCWALSGGSDVGNSTSHKNNPAIHNFITLVSISQ